jgi:hypothetical protein
VSSDSIIALRAERRALLLAAAATERRIKSVLFKVTGLKIGQVVSYDGKDLELYDVCDTGDDRPIFKGWLIRKDGTRSDVTRVIADINQIILIQPKEQPSGK